MKIIIYHLDRPYIPSILCDAPKSLTDESECAPIMSKVSLVSTLSIPECTKPFHYAITRDMEAYIYDIYITCLKLSVTTLYALI